MSMYDPWLESAFAGLPTYFDPNTLIDYGAKEPRPVSGIPSRYLPKILREAENKLSRDAALPCWTEQDFVALGMLYRLIPALQSEIVSRAEAKDSRRRERQRAAYRKRQILRIPPAVAWQMFFRGHLEAVRARA
jgi:hypothetical protein